MSLCQSNILARGLVKPYELYSQESIWNELIMACFEGLSHYFVKETEENHEKPLSE
jgi:hypothetical protein